MIARYWKYLQIEIEKFLLKPRSRKTLQKFVIFTFGVTILITTYFLGLPYLAQKINYKQGDISEEYIRVSKDINYELKDETQKKRQEAFNKSPFIFNRDYNSYKKVVEQATSDFNKIFSLNSEHISDNQFYENVTRLYPYMKESRSISRMAIVDLKRFHKNPDPLIHWVSEYATLVFDNFGLLDEKVENLTDMEKSGIRVLTDSDGKEFEFNWNIDRILYVKDIFHQPNYSRLTSLGPAEFREQLSPGVRQIIYIHVLQLYYNTPYMHFNNFETTQRKEEAASKVKPVFATLKKGLTIARPGDPIDSEKLKQIQLLNEHQGSTSFKNILGIFLIQLVLSVAIAFYIYQYSDFSMRDLASYLILMSQLYIIIFLSFSLSRIQSVQNSNMYFALFIPMIFMAVILGILLGPRITFAAGAYISLFLFYLSGFETGTLVLSIVSVLTGIYVTRKMSSRSDFFNSALIAGFVLALTTLGMDLSLNRIGQNTQVSVILSFFNAFISIVLAIGILPVYEGIFNIPTRFRLMELSDINTPLLKQLSTDAPSSYSHSLLMASMSEKAVSAIGGDTLLTRVGCLYHDIGKMLNAGIYAENKNLENYEGAHIGYTPIEYARTIIQHVNDGINLARQYRLPEKVIAFIPEHHGTTVMHYFYHESLKKIKNKRQKPPDKALFQYPGPKPQSKETAVVMIADSIEAASRTITDPTKENYVKLIDKIINNKNDEDQLDECNLTMNELRIIKDSFLETLMSTFHLRPKYPSKSRTKQLEKNLENKKQQTGKTNAST